MKIFSFWLKFVCILGGVIAVASLVVTGVISHHYASTTNKNLLKEVSSQAEVYRQELEEDIRYLVADLIQTQLKPYKPSKVFPIYGSIDKKNYEVQHIYPRAYPLVQKGVSQINYNDFKKFPVFFHALPWTADNKQVLVLVDVGQIQKASLPQYISKESILFGMVSVYGLTKLTQSLKNKGLSEAFVLDRKKFWNPIHSKVNYSGYSMSAHSSILPLLKESPSSWSQQIDSENILTTGIKMKILDAYLVLNKTRHQWRDYYMASLGKIFPLMLALGLIILLISVLIFYPVFQAYEYLAQIFKSYAVSAKFPIPPDVKGNSYITHTLPWLKNIYWKLREQKLTVEKDYLERDRFFSVMIKRLAQELEKKYPHIRMSLDLSADMALPIQENWLKQAFLEILKNAVECMNYTGSVEIHTRKEDTVFYCTVRDHGPGMNQEIMDQACNAYFSSKNNSTGLGLTLASSALHRVGAHIYFSNADDGRSGLIVQVALPLNLSQKVSRSEGVQI